MDADNELYDAACELLAAAQRLSRAAAGAGIEPAVPATLGRTAAALGALAVACAAMGRDPGARRVAFDGLVSGLREAQGACEATRSTISAPIDA